MKPLLVIYKSILIYCDWCFYYKLNCSVHLYIQLALTLSIENCNVQFSFNRKDIKLRTKSEERRQKILDVAAKIFAKHGFENASMTDISAKVGGSKATIYSYFKSKEEIFSCAVQKFADEKRKALLEILNDDGLGIDKALFRYGVKLTEFLTQPQIIAARRMIVAPNTSKEIANFFYEKGQKCTYESLSEYFKTQIDNHTIVECDPVLVARQFLALIVHPLSEPLLFQTCTKITKEERDQVVQSAVDIILKFYKAPIAESN